MPVIAKKTGGSSFEPVPEGLQKGICYGVYDIGTQFNKYFDKSSRQVIIVWELPAMRIEIEERDLPRSISKIYTLSLHEKSNLRKDLQTWRGKQFTAKELEGFDLSNLLGVGCQLQIMHSKKDDKVYANIATIIPVDNPKDQLPENDLREFSLDNDMPIPENTPDWIIEKIKASEEWEEKQSGNRLPSIDESSIPPEEIDDDIPF